MKKRRHLLRDIALYVLISVSIVAVLVVAALSKIPGTLILNSFGFFMFTAGTFGFFVEKARPFWRVKIFWAWAVLLLILHSVILVAALNRGVQLGKIWWVFALEMIFLIQMTRLVFRSRRSRKSHQRELPDL
jgi:hypothetical protein